jgi:hypothetical protein
MNVGEVRRINQLNRDVRLARERAGEAERTAREAYVRVMALESQLACLRERLAAVEASRAGEVAERVIQATAELTGQLAERGEQIEHLLRLVGILRPALEHYAAPQSWGWNHDRDENEGRNLYLADEDGRWRAESALETARLEEAIDEQSRLTPAHVTLTRIRDHPPRY